MALAQLTGELVCPIQPPRSPVLALKEVCCDSTDKLQAQSEYALTSLSTEESESSPLQTNEGKERDWEGRKICYQGLNEEEEDKARSFVRDLEEVYELLEEEMDVFNLRDTLQPTRECQLQCTDCSPLMMKRGCKLSFSSLAPF